LDAPAGIAKIAFAGQLGWLTSTLDGSLIYLAAFILSRKYAALMMKSTPGLMKRAMPLRLRTHLFRQIRTSTDQGVRVVAYGSARPARPRVVTLTTRLPMQVRRTPYVKLAEACDRT
jgi:hypothetical protein